MARPAPPLWLTRPTRMARLTRRDARIVVAILAGFLLLSLTALISAGPPPVTRDASGGIAKVEDRADVLFYQSVIAGLRGGGDYYHVAADAQRASGYPMRPFVTMRLPTLALVQAALPDWATLFLLYALVAAVLAAWLARLRPLFVRTPPLLIAVILIGCGSMVYVRADLSPFHEIWAGLLIALSLAWWRPDRWVGAVALGACAMVIRETAALYAIAMFAMALLGGRRREAIGWCVALALLALVVAAHIHGWSQVVRTDDGTGPGWSGMLGFGFFVKTMTLLTALDAIPLALGALLVALALFGWTALPDPVAPRAVAVFAAYAALIALFCRTDTYYWGLLVAPILLAGLAFVPDALRDLYRAGTDRRRITITRVRRTDSPEITP
ncbi:conserved membrane hypothetical protein [Sphingomonas sp. EC-HK361]|uniref:hypothetical protein n=1 Tax=Sphingomonas sp. EC-HK361 TaxID=2038397 RepID=UPI0012584115|nr:hypothetical protein [Sphingomonas sp. EC-HK361]VVT06712.1 conserved membrane hypothetical protein [Sphingomonas sp. EC-HK361]